MYFVLTTIILIILYTCILVIIKVSKQIKQIDGLQKLFDGPDCVVVAGYEKFDPLGKEGPGTRTGTRMSMGSRINVQSRMQKKRERLSKTSMYDLQ